MCICSAVRRFFVFYAVSFVFSAPVEQIEEDVFHLGSTATLHCVSNDNEHNFYAWELPDKNLIVPSNPYDNKKYEYEVSSGKLIIKNITETDQGEYVCHSRAVRGEGMNLHKVKLTVQKNSDKGSASEHDKDVNYFRVIVIVGSVFVIFGGIFYAYRLISGRSTIPRYSEHSDDEDSGEELFSVPSTSKRNETSPMLTRAVTSNYEKLPEEQ